MDLPQSYIVIFCVIFMIIPLIYVFYADDKIDITGLKRQAQRKGGKIVQGTLFRNTYVNFKEFNILIKLYSTATYKSLPKIFISCDIDVYEYLKVIMTNKRHLVFKNRKQQIFVKNPSFNQEYVVTSNDSELVTLLLTDEIQSQLLRLNYLTPGLMFMNNEFSFSVNRPKVDEDYDLFIDTAFELVKRLKNYRQKVSED